MYLQLGYIQTETFFYLQLANNYVYCGMELALPFPATQRRGLPPPSALSPSAKEHFAYMQFIPVEKSLKKAKPKFYVWVRCATLAHPYGKLA